MVKRILSAAQIISALMVVFLLGGCAGSVSIDPSDSFELRREVISNIADEYRLQIGDRVSIVCVVNEQLGATNPYYINTGDVISVIVQDRTDLSYQYKVNPDGTVQFLQLDAVHVAGLTLNDLRPRLEQLYSNEGIGDSITVGFTAYNTAVDSFIDKLSPGGIGREPFASTVSIDGNANFPLIGFVQLNDLTLQEANSVVAEKYREHFKSIDVTLRIEVSTGHNITVLGEVYRPGSFAVDGTLSVLSALGVAGGHTNTAEIDSIMTVQRRGKKIYVNKFDLNTDMFAMANAKLIAGDFIFVPKTTIANVNIFVDQYLRKSMPFNLGVNGTFLVSDL